MFGIVQGWSYNKGKKREYRLEMGKTTHKRKVMQRTISGYGYYLDDELERLLGEADLMDDAGLLCKILKESPIIQEVIKFNKLKQITNLENQIQYLKDQVSK